MKMSFDLCELMCIHKLTPHIYDLVLGGGSTQVRISAIVSAHQLISQHNV